MRSVSSDRGKVVLAVGIIFISVAAPSAHAQQKNAAPTTTASASLAGVMGVAVDSLHGGPLKSAVISVEGTNRKIVADPMGRFRIDSLPPGKWRLSLSHPLVDSLGYDITSPPIELIAGRLTLAVLATPSARTLRKIVCPARDTGEANAVLLGVVREADTDAPLVGARVSLVYTHTEVSKTAGVRRLPHERLATSGVGGTYAICGLPTILSGTIQASLNGTVTAEVPVTFSDEQLALKALAIGVPALAQRAIDSSSVATANPARAPSLPSPTQPADTVRVSRTGRAAVRGHVFDEAGAGVNGAQVGVPGTSKVAVTGSDGAFALDGLPSGTSQIVARKIGFSPASAVVDLTARQPRNVTLMMTKATVTLEAVTVTATIAARLQRVGFAERRKMGLGRFIDTEEIERRQPMSVTDIIQYFPGFRIEETQFGRTIVPTRSVSGQSANCINLFIDHVHWDLNDPGDLDRALNVNEIAAVETYAGGYVPQEFSVPNKNCATIVIWTKAKLDEK